MSSKNIVAEKSENVKCFFINAEQIERCAKIAANSYFLFERRSKNPLLEATEAKRTDFEKEDFVSEAKIAIWNAIDSKQIFENVWYGEKYKEKACFAYSEKYNQKLDNTTFDVYIFRLREDDPAYEPYYDIPKCLIDIGRKACVAYQYTLSSKPEDTFDNEFWGNVSKLKSKPINKPSISKTLIRECRKAFNSERMTEKQRKAIIRYCNNESIANIADDENVSESTIQKRISSAKFYAALALYFSKEARAELPKINITIGDPYEQLLVQLAKSGRIKFDLLEELKKMIE